MADGTEDKSERIVIQVDPWTPTQNAVELFKSLNCEEEEKSRSQILSEKVTSELQNQITGKFVGAGIDYGVSLIPGGFPFSGSGGPSGNDQDNGEWPLLDRSFRPDGHFDPNSILTINPDTLPSWIPQQPVDWVPERAVTPGSADGWSPRFTDGFKIDWHQREQGRRRLNPDYWPGKEEKANLTANSRFRPIPESTPGSNYTLMSPEEWKRAIQSFGRFTTNIESGFLPAMNRLGDYSGVARVNVGELAGTVRSEVTPAIGMLSDESIQSAIAFDGFGDSMEGTRQLSSELRGALPADAAAMGDGVYHGLEPGTVGVSRLADAFSDLFQMALTAPEVMNTLPSISFGEPQDGSKSTSGDGGRDSSGNTDAGGPDRVSYEEALYSYWRTSGETAENIAWMKANPDAKIDTGPNKGWTFTKLMRDHVNKGGGKPGFAMGGVVPGPIGAPVPALLHGGERVLRSGQSGGGPTNVTLHVHGNVVSERELVRSVREGLIRLNREVTEMGF